MISFSNLPQNLENQQHRVEVVYVQCSRGVEPEYVNSTSYFSDHRLTTTMVYSTLIPESETQTPYSAPFAVTQTLVALSQTCSTHTPTDCSSSTSITRYKRDMKPRPSPQDWERPITSGRKYESDAVALAPTQACGPVA